MAPADGFMMNVIIRQLARGARGTSAAEWMGRCWAGGQTTVLPARMPISERSMDMTLRSITGIAGMALGLAMTAGVASAQTGPYIGGPNSPAQQQQLMNGPGYSTGTASAQIGGANSPAQQQQLVNGPGYSTGTASAQIGGPAK